VAATGCWKIEMAKNVPISTASGYPLRNMVVNDEHDPRRVSVGTFPNHLRPGHDVNGTLVRPDRVRATRWRMSRRLAATAGTSNWTDVSIEFQPFE
jgi:hypothetical protein